MKHTLYVIVKVEIDTELDIDAAIEEISSESYYTIESTENVTVQNTVWILTSTTLTDLT